MKPVAVSRPQPAGSESSPATRSYRAVPNRLCSTSSETARTISNRRTSLDKGVPLWLDTGLSALRRAKRTRESYLWAAIRSATSTSPSAKLRSSNGLIVAATRFTSSAPTAISLSLRLQNVKAKSTSRQCRTVNGQTTCCRCRLARQCLALHLYLHARLSLRLRMALIGGGPKWPPLPIRAVRLSDRQRSCASISGIHTAVLRQPHSMRCPTRNRSKRSAPHLRWSALRRGSAFTEALVRRLSNRDGCTIHNSGPRI
jgi:hypothetical protein